MSAVGIALLLDRAGGKLTPAIADVVGDMTLTCKHAEEQIKDVRKIWDEWDMKEVNSGDDALEYYSFYNGFMAPYFGCFKCDDTIQALSAIDMNTDNNVDWNEFQVYLKWAVREYPNIKDADELLSVTFRKGILPAMRDEVIRPKDTKL